MSDIWAWAKANVHGRTSIRRPLSCEKPGIASRRALGRSEREQHPAAANFVEAGFGPGINSGYARYPPPTGGKHKGALDIFDWSQPSHAARLLWMRFFGIPGIPGIPALPAFRAHTMRIVFAAHPSTDGAHALPIVVTPLLRHCGQTQYELCSPPMRLHVGQAECG